MSAPVTSSSFATTTTCMSAPITNNQSATITPSNALGSNSFNISDTNANFEDKVDSDDEELELSDHATWELLTLSEKKKITKDLYDAGHIKQESMIEAKMYLSK